MDGDEPLAIENPIRRAMAEPVADVPDDNPIRRAAFAPAAVYAAKVVEQGERDKWDWNRLKSGLEEVGADPAAYEQLRPSADLQAARRKVRVESPGLTTGQAFRRSFAPFQSLLGGSSVGGRRVVSLKEYTDAAKRLNAGTHTADDAEAVATYEYHQQIDKGIKDELNKDPYSARSLGTKFAVELGHLGQIGGEMIAGGAALGAAVKGVRALRGVKAASDAAAVAAPSAGRVAAARIPQTATAPSLYVPLAQQNNVANGRDPNDLKGYPPAFAYGYATMLVLGRLQKGIGEGFPPWQAIKKGALAKGELQAVDTLAGIYDEIAPKAMKVKPTEAGHFGDLGEWLGMGKPARTRSEILSDATAQVLAFATFGGIHEAANRRGAKAEALAQSYADAVAQMRKSGMSEAEAAAAVQDVNAKVLPLVEQGTADKAAVEKALGGTLPEVIRDYAKNLAEQFPEKPAEPPPDQAPLRVGDKVQGKPGETLTVTELHPDGTYVAESADGRTLASASVASAKKVASDATAAKVEAAPETPPVAPESSPVAERPAPVVDPSDGAVRLVETQPAAPAEQVLPEGAKSSSVIRREARRARMARATEPPPKVDPAEAVAAKAGLESKAGPDGTRTVTVGGREIYLKHDARTDAVDLSFNDAGDTASDARAVPGRLRGETLPMLRAVRSVVKAAAETGTSITYEAEARRHALYEKELKKQGFVLESFETQSALGQKYYEPHYVWRPRAAADPAKVEKAAAAEQAYRAEAAKPEAPEPVASDATTPEPAPKTPAAASARNVPVGKVQEFGGAFRVTPDGGRKSVTVDNKALAQAVAEYAKADTTTPEGTTTRNALAAFIENIDGGTPQAPARSLKADAETVGRRAASVWAEAKRLGLSADFAALERVMAAAGLTKIEAAGRGFDGTDMRSESPISTGTPVRVVTPGWEMPSKGGRYIIEKAVVEKAASDATPAEPAKPDAVELARVQQIWDMLDAKGRKDNPELRAELERLGGDPESKPFTGRERAEQEHAKVLLPEDIDASLASAPKSVLSPSRAKFLREALEMVGDSYQEIADRHAVTKQRVEQAAKEGFEKIAAHDPATWGRFDSLEAAREARRLAVRQGAREARMRGNVDARTPEDEAIDRESDDVKAAEQGFFGGAPVRLKFLEGLFGSRKAGDRTLLKRFADWFRGTMPESARKLDQQKERDIAAAAFDVTNNAKDLRAAMRKAGMPSETAPQEALDRINAWLAGEGPIPQLPQPVFDAMARFRRSLDGLTDQLIAVGAVPARLVPTLDAHKGMYLHRQYQIFDPERRAEWVDRISKGLEPHVVNKFLALMTEQFQEANKGQLPSPEYLEGQMKIYLGEGSESPLAWLAKASATPDGSVLAKRGDLPDALRAFWGEVKDPVQNYVQSAQKMIQLIHTTAYLKRVASDATGKWMADSPDMAGKLFPDTHQLKKFEEPEGTALHPLNGMIVRSEVYDAFKEAFSPTQLNAGMRLYMSAVAAAKASKIVLSHTGIERNFLSNVLIAVRNGWWSRPGKLFAAFKAMSRGNDTPESRAYYRRMIELGVVRDTVAYGDFKKTVDDALGDRAFAKEVASDARAPADLILARGLKSLVRGSAKLYRAADEVWRVYGFEVEKARYEKAGMTPEQAEAKAAEVVRNTHPTYSLVPEGIKKLRRFPLAGPFPSFAAEVVRTTKNAARLGWEESRSANPEIRKIGYRRLAGLVAAAGVPVAALAIMRQLLGVSDAEDKAVRRTLPEYQKGSQVLYTGRDPDGKPRHVDFSRLDPHAILADTVAQVFRGVADGDARKGLENGIDELAKPFVGEELLVRPLLDVARNKKEQGGSVYKGHDTPFNVASDAAAHLAQPFVPGGYGAVRRLYKGVTGSPEQRTGEVYVPGEVAQEQVTGSRVQLVQPKQWFADRSLTADRELAEANGVLNKVLKAKGIVSDQDLSAAFDRSEAMRRKVFDELAKDVDAALALKMTRAEVFAALKKGGLSEDDARAVMSGRYRPHLPVVPPGPDTGTARARADFLRRRASTAPRP